MARLLHVRLDDGAEDALGVIRADLGTSDSEAVRAALREAAERRRQRAVLCAEVQALRTDADDERELRYVREQMAELAPSVEE